MARLRYHTLTFAALFVTCVRLVVCHVASHFSQLPWCHIVSVMSWPSPSRTTASPPLHPPSRRIILIAGSACWPLEPRLGLVRAYANNYISHFSRTRDGRALYSRGRACSPSSGALPFGLLSLSRCKYPQSARARAQARAPRSRRKRMLGTGICFEMPFGAS